MEQQSSTETLSSACNRWVMGLRRTACALTALLVASANAQVPMPAAPTPAGTASTDSREEILKTFQREAHAAYAEAKQACQPLAVDEKTVCLAKARLQFDEDMRYAKMRADLGY